MLRYLLNTGYTKSVFQIHHTLKPIFLHTLETQYNLNQETTVYMDTDQFHCQFNQLTALKMKTTFDGIKVTTDNRGCITYHLPPTYHKENFIQWKQDHRAEIAKIRNTGIKTTT